MKPQFLINHMKQIIFGLLAAVVSYFCVASHSDTSKVRPETIGSSAKSSSDAWKARPETYGVAVERNIKVKMSDGAQLLVDVYRPTDGIDKVAGKAFPVLLTQNPYAFAQEKPESLYVDFYVKRGYICVIAHVRGTDGSEGETLLWGQREQLDGADLVDWIATKLKGSNGTVGLFGPSWLGFTQLFTAARLSRGSPVKAMVPTFIGAYVYRDFAPGGVPSTLTWILRDLGAFVGNESGARFGQQKFAEWNNGGDVAYDNAFWRSREVAYIAERIVASGIPALIVGGWQDFYPAGSSELYVFLQNLKAGKKQWGPMAKGQKAADIYQLVMGPWEHYSRGMGLPKEQGLNVEMTLAWYDKWMMGTSIPQFETSTPFHAYNMGDKKWYDFATYPFSDGYSAFFFRDAQRIEKTLPAGMAKVAVAFGPRTREGTTHTFRTDAFNDTAIYAGPGAVRLFASSSGSNMTFMVEVYDVDGSGKRQRITHGNVLGSLRALDGARSWYSRDKLIRPFLLLQKDEPVEPGKVYQLDFPLAPTLATINAGHHLEVVLSTMPAEGDCAAILIAGTFPCFPHERHLKQLNGGTFTVYIDKDHPSMLNLPLSAGIKLTPSSVNYASMPSPL